jgi:lambda family phage portal protein
MGIIGRLESKPAASGARGVVGYAAAQISRLTASLATETEFINTTLRYQLRALRARSRQASQNNPYAKRFFQMVVDNVCGPQPFRLQAKVKFQSGELDERGNALIEAVWKAWGRAGQCELTGRWSWNTLQRLAVRNLAVDGELLLRKLRGPEFGPHGWRLQLLDVDRLDDQLNKSLPGGGAIHMGVEVDSIGKPVAYHLLKRRPKDWQFGFMPREHDRVPADEIVHLFVPDFAEQVRGVPWIYAALLNLVHEGAFEEAAVIAARVGAAQMGFIQSKDGGGTLAEAGIDGKDSRGNPQIDADPGTFPMLPAGYTVEGWNPKYPDAAVGPFIKAMLRGIAAGVGVAYHNLAGDMEGVNYSSARVAELDERDAWLAIQTFVADHLHDPMYPDWLRMQVLVGRLPFDLSRLEKYHAVYWQARRWAWVDPEKEVKAAVSAIDNRLKSRTRIIAEGGEDIEDVFGEFAAEQKLATKKGVALPAGPAGDAGSKPKNQTEKPDGEDAEQD